MSNALNNLRADIEELAALGGQLADALTAERAKSGEAAGVVAAQTETQINELDAEVQGLLRQFKAALDGTQGSLQLADSDTSNSSGDFDDQTRTMPRD